MPKGPNECMETSRVESCDMSQKYTLYIKCKIQLPLQVQVGDNLKVVVLADHGTLNFNLILDLFSLRRRCAQSCICVDEGNDSY